MDEDTIKEKMDSIETKLNRLSDRFDEYIEADTLKSSMKGQSNHVYDNNIVQVQVIVLLLFNTQILIST